MAPPLETGIANPKIQKTVWCAVYTRKSTDENLDSDFTSLDSQREYCSSFIKSREPEGWKLFPEQYSDPGFSGGNMDRPGLKKLISDAHKGKFQVVVCYKYDRLSRNTKDFLHILEIFDRNKVAFVSVTQPIDTTSSVGRLMRSILMDFAQFEREMISERTRDKMLAMAKKGKRTGGFPLLGYDIDRANKRLVVNKDEAKIVNWIFETYKKEKSLSVTANLCREKGYHMKEWITRKDRKMGGGKFVKNNLVYLLRNTLYVGKIRFAGQLYDGEQEPIISDNLFMQVQDILEQNGEKRTSPNQDKHNFLLKGLIRCATCNSMMSPNFSYSRTGDKHFYYRCNSTVKLDKSACIVRAVPARAMEEFVVERLKVLSKDSALLEGVVQRAKAKTQDDLPVRMKEKSFVSTELGKVEAEARNLTAILGEEGPNSKRREFVMERLDELSRKREDLRMRLIQLESEIVKMESCQISAQTVRNNLTSFMEVFERLKPEQKKEFIQLLVKEVIYDKAQSHVRLGLIPFQSFEWGLDGYGVSFDESPNWLPG